MFQLSYLFFEIFFQFINISWIYKEISSDIQSENSALNMCSKKCFLASRAVNRVSFDVFQIPISDYTKTS